MVELFLLSFYVVFSKVDLNFDVNLLGVFPIRSTLLLWYSKF